MIQVRSMTPWVAGLLALSMGGCYRTFDEGLTEVDVRGKVVIDPSLYGISSFADLSEQELSDVIAGLGVVYIGAFAGVQNDSNTLLHASGVLDDDENWAPFTLPTYDPASLFTFPYSGTTIGNYTNGCTPALTCQVVRGRHSSLPAYLDYFELREAPDYVADAYNYPSSRYVSVRNAEEDALADGTIDETEQAELDALRTKPVATEEEYVNYCLKQTYFRAYLPSEGCTPLADGSYDLTTCNVSDFNFYGDVPWVVNSAGQLEASFWIPKLALPPERTAEPVLWAYLDQNHTTCDPTYGYQWQDCNPNAWGVCQLPLKRNYFGGPSEYSLTKPWFFMEPGDFYTHYADSGSAQRITTDGTEVVITLNGLVQDDE